MSIKTDWDANHTHRLMSLVSWRGIHNTRLNTHTHTHTYTPSHKYKLTYIQIFECTFKENDTVKCFIKGNVLITVCCGNMCSILVAIETSHDVKLSCEFAVIEFACLTLANIITLQCFYQLYPVNSCWHGYRCRNPPSLWCWRNQVQYFIYHHTCLHPLLSCARFAVHRWIFPLILWRTILADLMMRVIFSYFIMTTHMQKMVEMVN